MGRPKAVVEIDGATMAGHVVGALSDLGAVPVFLVGGDPGWAADLGVDAVADGWPGEGPLAATATALAAAAEVDPDALVVVAACDQPWLTGSALGALVAALAGAPGGQVAIARTPDGRRHPFPSVWRAGTADLVAHLVEGGARRADAAMGHVAVVDVATDPAVVADVDRPEDLG